jgi:hypothetical protein
MIGICCRCTIDIRNKNQWSLYCNTFEELYGYLSSMSMKYNILEFKEEIENMILKKYLKKY